MGGLYRPACDRVLISDRVMWRANLVAVSAVIFVTFADAKPEIDMDNRSPVCTSE